MPSPVQLQTIRAQARELADEVNSTFVTDATANLWVNAAYRAVYDMLIAADPDWGLAESIFDSQAGILEYALPDDFYQARGVDRFPGIVGVPGDDQASRLLAVENERYQRIEPFSFLDRGREQEPYADVRWHATAPTRYRIIRNGRDGSAGRIRLEPNPGTRTWRLWYVSAADPLELDTDFLDGINGFEEYIIADVAEKMMVKAEVDPSGARKIKAEQEARIKHMAHRRHQDQPSQVVDLRGRRGIYPHRSNRR